MANMVFKFEIQHIYCLFMVTNFNEIALMKKRKDSPSPRLRLLKAIGLGCIIGITLNLVLVPIVYDGDELKAMVENLSR